MLWLCRQANPGKLRLDSAYFRFDIHSFKNTKSKKRQGTQETHHIDIDIECLANMRSVGTVVHQRTRSLELIAKSVFGLIDAAVMPMRLDLAYYRRRVDITAIEKHLEVRGQEAFDRYSTSS